MSPQPAGASAVHAATSTAPPPAEASYTGFGTRQAALVEAIHDTEGVVNSDEFRNRFADVNNVAVTPLGPIMSGQTILDAYATRVPIHYVHSDATDETGDTDTQFTSATCNLPDLTVDRWVVLKGDRDLAGRVRRACVINTLAHEWTHAVPDPGNPAGTTLFIDTGWKRSKYPLVSDTVGAIAQCQYLVKYAAITDDKFWSCVHGVGTAAFYGLTVCEDTAWLDRLRAGEQP